ncbi:hypothetical protein [Terriglobus aquaticus]|uniref:Orotate phosphoribosyltransferase n=1 Tax=Terriglobus aquaticus TaxID=940139 RepID=A0ABW9KM72_9BACT|nr:hypothetical protein [Terriglobus aquaticus]
MLMLKQMLDMTDEDLRIRLLHFVRASGVKFQSRRAVERMGWAGAPQPSVAKFYCVKQGQTVLSREPMLWDMRAPLFEDEALCCCSILLWRRACKYDPQWVGGPETSSLPITAGILAVNRAAGVRPLYGFYLRKQRKPDGLRRLLEGAAPPRGSRVLLVDDILNRGISKQKVLRYCEANGLTPAALLVLLDTEGQGRRRMLPVCPVESLLNRREVMNGRSALQESAVESVGQGPAVRGSGRREAMARQEDVAVMRREDVELVRLARDTVAFAALSHGAKIPTLREDGRGSSGYLPFLGRYLEERRPVFVRISKREYREGRYWNRNRGCQAAGLFRSEYSTVAEMTMESAAASATRARRIGPGRGPFHKPVWPEELGSLSVFLYVVEAFVPTMAKSAVDLMAEGHDVQRWGLVAEFQGRRGVVCGGLNTVTDIPRQVEVALWKMRAPGEQEPVSVEDVTFTRMRGRWLWDPCRPKDEYF